MEDIALKNNDLMIKDGDLVAILGEEQTVDMLAMTEQGEWKVSPEDGLGLQRYIGAPAIELQRLKAKTIEGLRRNRIKGVVDVEDNKLIINIEI